MGQKTILLHIGTAKTGTTSIQKCLAQAQTSGSLGAVCYPLWRDDYNHQRLAMLYRPHADLPRKARAAYPSDNSQFQNMRQNYRNFVFDQLRSAPGAILSAETLSVQPAAMARSLRKDLESLGFRKFHIVLYVRDPADYYLSMTQQWLKSTAEPPLVIDPASFTYEFREFSQAWESAFPGNLIVRKYPTGHQHDILEDFGSVLTETMGVSLPNFPIRMNTTISAEGMQILQDYRDTYWPANDGFLTPDTIALIGFLEETAKNIPQTPPVLNKAVAELIRANHSADAEFMFTHYGVDLGLGHLGARQVKPCGKTYRVDKILESIDQEIVNQLLLRLARTELGRSTAKRPLPWRVAAGAYRRIPASRRPARLDSWLRSVAKGESRSAH